MYLEPALNWEQNQSTAHQAMTGRLFSNPLNLENSMTSLPMFSFAIILRSPASAPTIWFRLQAKEPAMFFGVLPVQVL